MFCHNKTAFFVTFYVFRSNCFRTLAVILVSDLKELIIIIIIIITYLFYILLLLLLLLLIIIIIMLMLLKTCIWTKVYKVLRVCG